MKYEATCYNCKVNDAVWNISQIIIDDKLFWSCNISCEFCGLSIEEDGEGFPDKLLYDVLLKNSGCWKLVVLNEFDRPKALNLLRKILKLDFKVITSIFKEQHYLLWKGTKSECVWLKHCLEKQGILCDFIEPTILN